MASKYIKSGDVILCCSLGQYAGSNNIQINKTKTNGYSYRRTNTKTSEKAAYYVIMVEICSLLFFGMLYFGFPKPEIHFIDVVFFGPLGLFALFGLFAFYFNKKGDGE